MSTLVVDLLMVFGIPLVVMTAVRLWQHSSRAREAVIAREIRDALVAEAEEVGFVPAWEEK